MYIIVLLLIVIGTIVELFFKKNIKLYFYFIITILSLMLLFRFGQGQDYFGYKVKIDSNKKHQKLIIEYDDNEGLESLLNRFNIEI